MGDGMNVKFVDFLGDKNGGSNPFVSDFNMGLALPQSKSVRLNGLATCLRLEEVYWNILKDMAATNGCSVNALLSYVDREVHLRYGGVKNFSGLIRVVCVVHLLNAEEFAHLNTPVQQV